MHDYGLALGHAFQIADDVLDYAADETTLGTQLRDDLAEGKATLPLIHAMARSDAATRALLRRALEEGDAEAMPEVQAAIAAAGSLAYSLERARDYARAAERSLDGLAPNAAVAALRGLARYAVDRDR
jgi:octaprenyl-diphosphate synthase